MPITISTDADDDDNDDTFTMTMGGHALLTNMVSISDLDSDDNRRSSRGVSKKLFSETSLWKIDRMNWIAFYGAYTIDKTEEFNQI